MTMQDHREDVTGKAGDSRQSPSMGLRVVGATVILATVAVVTIAAAWLFAPELLTESRRSEGLIVRTLVSSLIVSGTGGLFMSAVTKNRWWLLTLPVAIGMVTLWLLIAGATRPLMH
jgi:hypothetical protein